MYYILHSCGSNAYQVYYSSGLHLGISFTYSHFLRVFSAVRALQCKYNTVLVYCPVHLASSESGNGRRVELGISLR